MVQSSLFLHLPSSSESASLSEMSSKELHMSSFDTEIGEDVGKMVPDGEGCVVARVREGVDEFGKGGTAYEILPEKYCKVREYCMYIYT